MARWLRDFAAGDEMKTADTSDAGGPTRRTIMGVLWGACAVTAAPQDVRSAVKAMEAGQGVEFAPYNPFVRLSIWPAISPDGRSMCWAECCPEAAKGDFRSRSLSIRIADRGVQQISRKDLAFSTILAISNDGRIVIIGGSPLTEPRKRGVFALAIQSGVKDDLDMTTGFGIEWEAESGNTSGSGAVVALGSESQVEVFEISPRRTIYRGAGRFPRLSPDGTRVAFVRNERLFIRLLTTGRDYEPIPETRVVGVGEWSPDGRFLSAGAWTRRFAFEKRVIIVEAATGRYAEVGTLGDGDWGAKTGWVSTKLLDSVVKPSH